MVFKLPVYVCKKCGETWHPRQEIVKCCPKCKNPKWNEPKKAQEGKK